MAKIFINLLLFVGLALSFCDFSTYYCNQAGISCPSFSNSINLNGTVYSAADFGIISFGDVTLNHGDTQDRIAVRNNFYGYNGISVADLAGNNMQYSLVIGENLQWNDNGAVTGNIYVGNLASASFPSSLSGQVSGGCSSSGCLNSFFDSMQSYWQQFSSNVALVSANVDVTISENGTATLNCQGNANAYVARIAASDFNAIVGYAISGSCSGSASWMFNIIGSGAVTFNGNPMQASGNIMYNVAPSTEITVHGNVNGDIVAPYANVIMVGGTITGHVIVGNFSTIVQVNMPSTCPPTGSSSSGSASGSASSGDNSSGDNSSTGASSASTTAGDGTAINTSTGVIGVTNNENSGLLMSSSIVLAIAIIALI